MRELSDMLIYFPGSNHKLWTVEIRIFSLGTCILLTLTVWWVVWQVALSVWKSSNRQNSRSPEEAELWQNRAEWEVSYWQERRDKQCRSVAVSDYSILRKCSTFLSNQQAKSIVNAWEVDLCPVVIRAHYSINLSLLISIISMHIYALCIFIYILTSLCLIRRPFLFARHQLRVMLQ